MLLNLQEYERAAAERLPKMVYGYYVGGANDEHTLTDNRRAYDRIRLRPRMMMNVSQRSTATRIFDHQTNTPIMIAPTAFAGMAHADGELAIARAAGHTGTPMTLSTMSNYRLEDVSDAARDVPLWFQLYVYKDRSVTEALVKRVEAAGYQALAVTVDTPLLGRREKDIRNEFHMPDGLTAANFYGSGMEHIEREISESGLASYIKAQFDDSLTWEDIKWLQSITSLPILVKGVLRGDDAAQAVAHGASGIIVSNHGGRQLDTAIATIDALPDVVAAVGAQVEVYIDGGVRRGTDVLKAIALGAQGVMVGRPVLWGLAMDGEAGVAAVLNMLHEEFDLAMALCGCRSIAEITPDLIA
jgi:4-hydroxymandelate oxidase